MGLATPVAIMVGNDMGARHGILFKTAVSLEETGRIEIVTLDKTGTITAHELMQCGFCMSYERPQQNCEMSRFVVSYFME